MNNHNAIIAATALSLLVFLFGCDPQKPKAQKTVSNSPGPAGVSRPTTLKELLPHPPGTHQQIINQDDGSKSYFTILVPQNYDRKNPTPLVLALHYGGSMPFYGKGILEGLVAPALADLNAIIVAPDVIPGEKRQGWCDEKNEKYLLELVDNLMRAYNIDSKKVLVTGFSMGGHGTFYIAARNQDRFTAAIPMAGRPRGLETKWEIPLYVIHSKDDERVKIGPTKQYVEKIKAEGADVTLPELEGLKHGPASAYQSALKESVEWLRKAWAEE